MNRFNLIRRFFLYFFMSCAGFLIFASVLPACKTSTSKTTKTFLECLESQEDIPLSIWIEAIAQESLQSIPTSEVVLIEEDHLTEIVRQIQTLIVRPNSNHDLVYEELVYTKGMSQENDPKAVQAINALRIENNTQTNLNAMDDEENVLYITNLIERDPL